MFEKLPLATAAKWLTFVSSVVIVLGIAPSQICLGLALAVMIVGRMRPGFPPIKLPAGLFVLGTLLAVALSSDPVAAYPQIKKMFVFTQLVVAYMFLYEKKIARWVVLSWAACATASAVLGFYQLAVKLYRIKQLHEEVYNGYVVQRITGFMSHWYTFSVLEMISLLMLSSFVLFSPVARKHIWVWVTCALLMALGLLFAETRAVWVATVVGGLYLLWNWKRWTIMLVPVLVAITYVALPGPLQQRAVSIFHPGADDSNVFRTILIRTGVEMVKAHPWFGLGPEMPRKQFMEYLPADIPRPLPSGSTMHLHNLYLEYAAERGIPVLLIFLWLIGKILWDFQRGLRQMRTGRGARIPTSEEGGQSHRAERVRFAQVAQEEPGNEDSKYILHGGIAVILALLVEGSSDVNLGDSEVLTMFLVIVALGYNALAPRETVSPQTQ